MEFKYWIRGDEVWGECHACGTPTKFADIVRMNAEDVEVYKVTYDEKEIWPIYKILLSYFFLYATVWFGMNSLGYSPNEIVQTLFVILVTLGPLSLLIAIVICYREEKKLEMIRRELLRKYGKEVFYPKNWTKWHTICPEDILVLSYGVDELPRH